MVPFTPCTWVCLGSIHWSHLHPVLLSVVGSNPRSDVLPVLVIKSMVPFTPCTCDQIHGPIYTLYLCLLWGQMHGPIYTLSFCLFWGQIHGLLYTLYLWWNPWSHLHPVLVSVVGSNAWSHLHPILLSVLGSNPWSALHPVLVMKSMVPFTTCTFVCCGV